jgi:hypothetical protein
MKKIISVVLLLAFLMCITACGGSGNPPSGGNPPAEATVYEVLNTLANKSYAKVNVKIETQTEGVQLSAEYALTQSNVQYKIEQLNLLPEDGSSPDASSAYKSTVSGSAAIQNGEIVLDGASVSLPSYSELQGAFKFEESNLSGIVQESGTLEASVVSPSAFYGRTANVQNMKVAVEYTQTALTKIVITYQASGTAVTATYAFEA